MNDKITILFIGGIGRSGSTLIDRILGQLEEVVAIGELRYFLRNGFSESVLCSCGEPFSQCQFWKRVLDLAKIDIQEVMLLSKQVDRIKRIPFMLFPSLSANFSSNMDQYQRILKRLYIAISEVSGRKIIVESTKHPSLFFLIREMFNVRLLHLVREPRGVAYSWEKMKVRPAFGDRVVYMPRRSVIESSLMWSHWNLWFWLAKKLDKSMFLRYEDFVANPKEKLSEITRFLEISSDIDIKDNKVFLSATHSILMHIKNGEVEIRLDDTWKSNLAWYKHLAVIGITWPLLLHYGYDINLNDSD